MNDAMNANGRTFFIDQNDMPQVTSRFEKMAKRAIKLGITPPSFAVVGEHFEEEVERGSRQAGEERFVWLKQDQVAAKRFKGDTIQTTGAVRTVKHIRIVGVCEIKLEGWSFAAVLDHELGEDNTIVRSAPMMDGRLPANWHNKGNFCDHCQRRQQRKATYVVIHENGDLKQVGSTCIRDFLGTSVETALATLDIYATLQTFLGGLGGGPMRLADTYRVTEYLAWVAKSIREGGWLSKGQAFHQGGTATAVIAKELMFDFRRQEMGR